MPANQIENMAPRWLSQIAGGHNLYFCRGLAFCATCGGVASATAASALLNWLRRKTIPPGSRSRLTRALAGKHPHQKQTTFWPDGSPSSERGAVYRVMHSRLLEVEVIVDDVPGMPMSDEEILQPHVSVVEQPGQDQDSPGAAASVDLGGMPRGKPLRRLCPALQRLCESTGHALSLLKTEEGGRCCTGREEGIEQRMHKGPRGAC